MLYNWNNPVQAEIFRSSYCWIYLWYPEFWPTKKSLVDVFKKMMPTKFCLNVIVNQISMFFLKWILYHQNRHPPVHWYLDSTIDFSGRSFFFETNEYNMRTNMCLYNFNEHMSQFALMQLFTNDDSPTYYVHLCDVHHVINLFLLGLFVCQTDTKIWKTTNWFVWNMWLKWYFCNPSKSLCMIEQLIYWVYWVQQAMILQSIGLPSTVKKKGYK